jgi:hypothetical protein
MPRFRDRSSDAAGGPLILENVRALIAELFRPEHFFLGADLEWKWEHVALEELVWEIFQGRLLDPAHTRQRRSFEAWNVYQAGAEEPLLALKLDAGAGHLHVVRGLDSYVWEGYDAGGNVYQSRERRKWVRELVGTIRLERLADLDELGDELACRLFQAVVGTSRLPLASVETPLPGYSFGRLFYCYRPDAPEKVGPLRTWHELVTDMLAPALNRREQARLLETFLHAAPLAELAEAGEVWLRRWSEFGRTTADLVALTRLLFNEVSLSPWTDLVEKTLAFLRVLDERGLLATEQRIDFLSYLLRHIGRHLTAYDLVVFHHRGANYPDALLLDAVLKEYLALIEDRSEFFAETADEDETVRHRKRIRRRALRQGWLLRRRYEGHAVPDLPTSPGENQRVLPSSHPRVPEEQITQPALRTRHLYADDPLARRLTGRAADLLRQSLADLEHPDEWRELGLAVFLDRPFGGGKAATEPDGTLLLSAEAFSASIARERLHSLAREVGESQRLPVPAEVRGLPLDVIGGAVRSGTVSLADARRAAADFVFLRTTPGSVSAFLAQYDFTPLVRRFRLDDLFGGADMLIARSAAAPGLIVYDAQLRPRLELEVATEGGYESRARQEYPVNGLRVLRVWETAQAHDLREEPILIRPVD